MKNKGITLVALVVTIIIMLILAGVTLRLTLGDNGLIKKAKETTEEYEDVVWIPRYAYSINEYHVEKNLEEGTTQNITKVEFIKGTGNRGFNGTTYETSYDEEKVTVGEPTPMIVHPAFTFGGKSLSGIWVAKFEASMAETNLNTTDNNDVPSGKTVKVLPSKDTWRYIEIGNAFINCYNMNRTSNLYGIRASETDSHLMKNIEWGCVAYLSASQYGVVPTINTTANSESGVWHQYSGGQNYKGNVTQSTTGNVTGIYDACGGNWEYVAAYYDNRDINLYEYGTEAFESNKQLKNMYKKYWDKYEVGNDEKTKYGPDRSQLFDKDTSYNKERIRITKERYELMKNYNGDAMHEVIGTGYSYHGVRTTTNTYDWMLQLTGGVEYGIGYYNDDIALVGNCALTFVYRGGSWFDDTHAGVFAMADAGGIWDVHLGFRPVLVV